MNKIIPAVALAAIVATSWGCSPAPVSCFTKEVSIVDIHEDVTFTNCSSDFSSLSWSFGDGTSSTEENPVKAWTTPADYLVALEVNDENGTRSDNSSEIVRVGKRYLGTLRLGSIPADNGGTPWDASDSPDLKVRMGKVADRVDLYASPENTNLATSLPYDINASALNIELTAETWYILLEDVDGATADTVAYWEMDLNAGFANYKVELLGTSSDVDVNYTVR